MSRVLIIGAGLSGLTAARELQASGHEVLVLDKSRGVGGRMATRRDGEATFDHGAQFFTARKLAFKTTIAEWHRLGIIDHWFDGYLSPHGEKTHDVYPRYCGAGGMTGIAKYLARDVDVHLSAEVNLLRYENPGWTVRCDTGAKHSVDKLLLTAPVPQSLALFDSSQQELPSATRQALESVRFEPCFAVMTILKTASQIPSPGALYVNEEPIAWIADNSQKGISKQEGAITIHSTGSFARKQFEENQDEVAKLLLDAAHKYSDAEVESSQVRRWRYSKPENPLEVGAMHIPELNLCFAGDGLNGARVEGAFLSGLAAARVLSK